jgi:hypothetical protein
MKNITSFFIILFTGLSINCFGQVRPDLIDDFTPAQRVTLVNLMQQYITVDVIEWHCNFRNLTGNNDLEIHDDFNFLPFHRAYMEGMEDFLILNGHPEFVPLPAWDPEEETPSEFQLVDADCLLTDCNINVSGDPSDYCDDSIDWDPNIDRSDYSELNDLCDYDYDPPSPPPVPWNDDDDELSRTLETPYHNDVHIDMGENMFSYASPSSPIFWNWHAYLDDMWKDWECSCSQSPLYNAHEDLYLKDNTKIMMHTRDVGKEPNIGPIWESGDIWVRKQQDGFTIDTSEDPFEYINSTSPVYVYVRVRNRGCSPSAGTETLSLHWSKGETPLTWPSYWDGSTSNGYAVMGSQINVQTIPVIAAQSSKILEFQWLPPNPDDYTGNSDPTDFCLLARQVSSNDPMTVAEVSDIEDNIDDNNNIVGKDITITNNQPPPPLPVELTSFLGERVREEIQLSWETSSETQNKGFEIHRSSNNSTWEKLGWVDGNGSSTQPHVYAFDDTKPAYGINYYRLKQIDFDGAFEYSKIIAIENNHSDFKIQVFPNPTTRNFNIRIANPLLQKMKIQINDNLGMKIWESNLMVGESGWSKELEIERNGVYLISIQLGNETYYERIVILGK